MYSAENTYLGVLLAFEARFIRLLSIIPGQINTRSHK